MTTKKLGLTLAKRNICRAGRGPMRSLMLTLAVCLTGGIAHADFDYQFNINASGSMDAFSFSFTSPTFVGYGATPAFAPFTVMDDLMPQNSWTMTQDLVYGLGSIFEFGTAGANLFSNSTGCGFGVNPPADGAFLPRHLSVADGDGNIWNHWRDRAFFYFGSNPNAYLAEPLTGSLTVSDVTAVPEPTSILLLGSFLGAVGWRVRRRRA